MQYEIIRSRRKTADIIINRDGNVIVRVPEGTGDDKVSKIVRSKNVWIQKQLADWKEKNSARMIREYKNGESFYYLGRNYRLKLHEKQNPPLRIVGECFYLNSEILKNGGIEAAKSAFRHFYILKGREIIPERVEYFSPKVGVHSKSVEVRDLGYRWGWCSPKGKINFHWKVIMAPKTIIDYIVVHELCHIHYLNHKDVFWEEMSQIIPDYREKKEWLRVNGVSFDL